MGAILIRGATVLTGDASMPVRRHHDVLIDGNRIAAVGAGFAAPTGAEVIDGTGALVMPGLIDTHNHAWQYAARGIGMRLWGHRIYQERIASLRERYAPQDVYESIHAAGLDMIERGITGSLDFFHAAVTEEHGFSALQAHEATGQRVLLAYGMGLGYPFHGQKHFAPPVDERLARVARLRARATGARVEVGIGASGVATSDDFWTELDFARSIGARTSMHQNGAREIARIGERGALGPDFVPVHCNALSDRELDLLAEADVPISVTPECECSVGRSLTVIGRAFRHGVRISFGIDTAGSAHIDLLQQLRIGYRLMQYLDAGAARDGARLPIFDDTDPPSAGPDDFLRAATANAAHALGRADLGRIEAGCLADVVLVRPTDRDAAETDPVGHLVLVGAERREIDTVIIDGVVRKRDGVLVGVADAAERAARLSATRSRILAAGD
ncbi:amidohydrolase family protein [Microbacterium sp. ASV81]|uniref:Amidohydrolase family protein n=1 Tax=Microbacterium capsulatum TaxID=3041921 RepID=A0ABU0XIJ7_9MICO|nr:amidohydrolase family protein [Microbacterium sp. ASV81]MDQ4214687.1 amidohydrolase family protein [Microbacterium sp. ASV81]